MLTLKNILNVILAGCITVSAMPICKASGIENFDISNVLEKSPRISEIESESSQNDREIYPWAREDQLSQDSEYELNFYELEEMSLSQIETMRETYEQNAKLLRGFTVALKQKSKEMGRLSFYSEIIEESKKVIKDNSVVLSGLNPRRWKLIMLSGISNGWVVKLIRRNTLKTSRLLYAVQNELYRLQNFSPVNILLTFPKSQDDSLDNW